MTAEPKKRRLQVLMRRDLWVQDEGLTVLLGALLLMIFIVNPLGAAGVFRGYAALVHDLWLALTLLSGALAIGWRRKAAQVVVLSAILLFALRVLGFAGGAGALGVPGGGPGDRGPDAIGGRTWRLCVNVSGLWGEPRPSHAVKR